MSEPLKELEQDATAIHGKVGSAIKEAFYGWLSALHYVRAHASVVKEVGAALCFVLLAVLLWRAL